SLVIGESLRRLLAYAGHHVTSDIHLGDWGLQMGQLLSEYRLRNGSAADVWFDEDYCGPYPAEAPVTVDDLQEMYQTAAAHCKLYADRLAEARSMTEQLQNGHPGLRALWQHFRTVSLASQMADISKLNAHFDLFLGESDAHPTIAGMIADLKADGFAAED